MSPARRREHAKQGRIATHIHSDGRQPNELWRTKSVGYSTANLSAMTMNAVMARKVGVDLLGYSTYDGKSIDAAYRYMAQFANGTADWMYPQITPGGPAAAIDRQLRPWLAQAEVLLDREILTPQARLAALAWMSPDARLMAAIPGLTARRGRQW